MPPEAGEVTVVVNVVLNVEDGQQPTEQEGLIELDAQLATLARLAFAQRGLDAPNARLVALGTDEDAAALQRLIEREVGAAKWAQQQVAPISVEWDAPYE